jgi:S-(hydroxymethyl)glutathione dehydrogenase / alcohol dehydrogenase
LDFIMEIINGILDFAVECSGTVKAMETCLLAVRNQGGKAVIVGNAHFGKKLEVDPFQFNLGKSILGTWGGDNNPDEDFLKYIKFVEEGKIDLYPFVSKTYRLEDINEAMDDLERGRVLRPLIDMKIGQ